LNCVEPELLSADEADWLDSYHARVRKTLSPLLDAKTRRWLKTATRKVGA
jgi:Xaa-Pro aminopeptidase